MSRPGPERRAQARRPRPHRVHIRGPLTARARRSISPSAAGWDTGRDTPGPRPRPTATWVRRNPRLRTQSRRPPHARSSLRRPDHAPTAGCDRQTSPRQARSVPRHRRPSPSWFQASDSPPSSRENSTSLIMSVDIHYEQLSDDQWRELLPLMQQQQVVRLVDCGITEARCQDVSSALRGNPALTELDLCNNELGDGGLRVLLQGLHDPACKIQTLSLQNCCLTEAGCGTLPDVLRSLPTLRELYLSYNPLGDAGLQLLCKGLLDPQCHIEKLQVEYCNLTAASCEALAEVLKTKRDLKELMVNSNELGEAGVRALCQGLAASTCPLESLKLESCGLTSANCQDLCGIVASKASLRELYLGNNKLGDTGIAELCPGLLSPSSRLKTLWLWECDITASGCRHLCRVLRTKESLKELSMAGNEVGDEGARLLCDTLLEPSCRLESLWVKSCSFTAACCQHFSAVLARNTCLLELQLGSNQLGDDGVQELCTGLSQPGTTLRELWLGDCEVTNSGCSSLAALLLTNRSLRQLDLSNNCMSDPGVLQLAESLQQPSCTLEKLVLFDIYVSEHTDDRLRALEESKPSLKIVY